MLDLEIIICTYNRSQQIERTIRSIAESVQPSLVSVKITIVDNNSSAIHRDRYQSLIGEYAGKYDIRYLCEPRQGKSHACNLGIEKAVAQWLAFVDDDEQLGDQWLLVAERWICSGEADYIGGPCLPDWEVNPPDWLPAHRQRYRGILGWIEYGPVVCSFDKDGIELCGGNFIIKTEVARRIGGFNVSLGRFANNLMCGEDGEFHMRLKSQKFIGFYDPELAISHYVPVARMSLRYHLRWAYWSGASHRVRIMRQPETGDSVPHWRGVPRFWYRKAINGVLSYLLALAFGKAGMTADGVIGLLDAAYFWGLLRGKKYLLPSR